MKQALSTARHPAHHPARLAATPARRSGTPLMAIAAFSAAWVLAACGPADGQPAQPTVVSAPAPVMAAQATSPAPTYAPQNAAPTYAAATGTPQNTVPMYSPQATAGQSPQSPQYTAATVPQGQVTRVAERSEPPAPPRAIYGQVSSIEPITSAPKTNGTGAVIGGVLGAVLGNQVGHGGGRAAATVLGGVGGAMVGNKVEKNRSENVVGYRVHVQLDNGSNRSFERNSLNGLDVGSRVRVDGGRLRQV